jgi:hypothetical protein
MVTYSLGLLLVLSAGFQRTPRILAEGIFAILLGFGLASFYLIPVMHEQKWINIAQVLSPGVRPLDNFLFTITADSDHNRFNWVVSAVAAGEMIVVAVAAFFAQRKLRMSGAIFARARWMLIAWSTFSSLLTFQFTLFAWNHFPELRFVQLPWRWLLCLNVGFALLVTIAWQRWLPRVLLLVAMLCLLTIVSHRFQPPWWDTAADMAEMLDNQATGQGYEGTDEYVPIHADSSEVKQDAPLISPAAGGEARIQIQKWTANSKVFSVVMPAPGQVVLRLFNYPAWRVEVNGRQVLTGTQEKMGQMVIPVNAGENRVQVIFSTTKDRILGRIVSGLSLLTVVGALFLQKRSKLRLSLAQ